MSETYSRFFFPQAVPLLERARSTRAEKQTLLPLMARLVHLGQRAKREGLLALEADLDTLGSPFLRMGLELVLAGEDPDDIAERMVTHLVAGDATGVGFLEGLLVLRGTLGIASGYRDLASLLVAFLGSDGDLWPPQGAPGTPPSHQALIGERKKQVLALPGRTPHEDLLAPLLVGADQGTLEFLLRNTGFFPLASALWNTTGPVLDRVLATVTEGFALGLLDEILGLEDRGASLWRDAQESLVRLLGER